jgi:hypothetical protein
MKLQVLSTFYEFVCSMPFEINLIVVEIKKSVKSIKYMYDITERRKDEHDASRATATPPGD